MYADVFSASMVRPKPKFKLNFGDDRVDYVEVSQSLTTDAHNANPEIGKYENQFESLHTIMFEIHNIIMLLCAWTFDCRFPSESGQLADSHKAGCYSGVVSAW